MLYKIDFVCIPRMIPDNRRELRSVTRKKIRVSSALKNNPLPLANLVSPLCPLRLTFPNDHSNCNK